MRAGAAWGERVDGAERIEGEAIERGEIAAPAAFGREAVEQLEHVTTEREAAGVLAHAVEGADQLRVLEPRELRDAAFAL